MSELANGLLKPDGKLRDLAPTARAIAKALLSHGVDVGIVDLTAEYLARWAEALDGIAAKADAQAFRDFAADLELPALLIEALAPAFTSPVSRAELAALAVFVVDITETMTFDIFGPELPSLSAKADRSGGAARSAGVAKRLRG